jgi:hypothetical protein
MPLAVDPRDPGGAAVGSPDAGGTAGDLREGRGRSDVPSDRPASPAAVQAAPLVGHRVAGVSEGARRDQGATGRAPETARPRPDPSTGDAPIAGAADRKLVPGTPHEADVAALPPSTRARAGAVESSPTSITEPGRPVAVPIVLEPAAGAAAAVSATISFDSKRLRYAGIRPGPAALAASKDVLANLAAPGEVRVIVVGLNDRAMEAGELARLDLEALAGTSLDAVPRCIALSDATISDAGGDPLDATVLVGEPR